MTPPKTPRRLATARLGCLLVAGLLLAGCNTTKPMEMPRPTHTGVSAAAANPMGGLEKMALTRVVADIPRGTVIAHLPSSGIDDLEGHLCNYRLSGNGTLMEWAAGPSSSFGDWDRDFARIFRDVMSQAGYEVAGDPRDLFGRDEELAGTRYQVGARLLEIKGNVCQAHDWVYAFPMDSFSAEFYVKVEWNLYDTLSKETIKRLTTEGYAKRTRSQEQGLMLTLGDAFAVATEILAADKEFHAFLSGENDSPALAAGRAGTSPYDSPITIAEVPDSARPMKETMDRTLDSVVLVRVGGGHGSGLIIDPRGYILTNAHVVGEADTVMVRLNSGIEVQTQVLRRHKGRDVALLKAPLGGLVPMPLRTRPAERLETVYAIGAPFDESLSATITQGTVSALRTDDKSGWGWIQSDVSITGGNSGGPLVDGNGNALGIVTQGIPTHLTHLAADLNFMVPIGEALDALNIRPAQPGS
ncbi:S1C family serine protease [Roseospirillum parvum]|uniref:Trypsin-like peptidase domain-containing protein n=1 Tax=Roseospirillum parvum TaxID=83401 RepID=A0A1G7X0U9_9PROT|nr:S1C family serine protease [Roseospirillum parvum]SDG77803.1 Trypsin-like peptidase domain-containing protein [Roseospirillum parvum]